MGVYQANEIRLNRTGSGITTMNVDKKTREVCAGMALVGPANCRRSRKTGCDTFCRPYNASERLHQALNLAGCQPENRHRE
jgi:hypothetical protein